MTIYKQVNSPRQQAAVEDVKVFMDRSVSAGRCRCPPPPSGERLTLGREDVLPARGQVVEGKLEAAASESKKVKLSHGATLNHESTKIHSEFSFNSLNFSVMNERERQKDRRMRSG